jgi:hypothetical protein
MRTYWGHLRPRGTSICAVTKAVGSFSHKIDTELKCLEKASLHGVEHTSLLSEWVDELEGSRCCNRLTSRFSIWSPSGVKPRLMVHAGIVEVFFFCPLEDPAVRRPRLGKVQSSMNAIINENTPAS